jgi:sugar phosphate isomerase/epimerase
MSSAREASGRSAATPFGMNDAIAAYYTLSGAAANTPARFSAVDRIAAAATAGYGAVGLYADDLDRWGPVGEIRRVADDHGVSVTELEFLVNWSLEGQAAHESRIVEGRLYALADTFGSAHINVGIREAKHEIAPLEVVAERFAALCDRAAAHGLEVAFEFMPFRALDTLAAAWEMVRLADRPNGGIVLDAWHWFRGTPDLGMIESVPADRISVVQLCDGHAEPVGSLIEDTLDHRLLPGEGAWDLGGLLGALLAHGVRAPVSVEILSADLRRRGLKEMADRTARATERVFSALPR